MLSVADLAPRGDDDWARRYDDLGERVIDFYGFKPPEYAVYLTDQRLRLKFADNPDAATAQRKLIAPLFPLRGEINGLIDGWARETERSRNWSKARAFQRRVGDAFVVAFEGDPVDAELLLKDIKQDILNERIARARLEYLLAAIATALGIAVLSALLTAYGEPMSLLDGIGLALFVFATVTTGGLIVSFWAGLRRATDAVKHRQGPAAADDGQPVIPWTPLLSLAALSGVAVAIFAMLATHATNGRTPSIAALTMWQAAIAGSIGAFFSIALAIKGRTVLPDLNQGANLLDALLRIIIGTVAGAVLVGILMLGAFDLSFGALTLPHYQTLPARIDARDALVFIAAGFLAGFLERLVPDLLAQAKVATESSSKQTITGAAKAAADARDAGKREATEDMKAKGVAEAPPTADEVDPVDAAVDGCVADVELPDDEATDDEDLPAATGGVAPIEEPKR